MNEVRQHLLSRLDSLSASAVTWRRDFHKYPEVAWTEFRTGSIVARRLLDMGGWEVIYGEDLYDKSMMLGMPSQKELDEHAARAIAQGGDPEIIAKMKGGYTGVLATLKTGDGDGPVVAFRVDIDANDLQEAQDEEHRPYAEGFSSQNPNAMHACGHDCHTAMGLLAAQALLDARDMLPSGTIKIVFQTGEEGGRGGQPMARAGIVDDADYFMAVHVGVGPDTRLGTIGCGVSNMSCSTKSDVTFTGIPAHAGGHPESGKNALLASANAAINLYAITRHSEGATRVNVGVLNAGVGRNVIAPNAYMKIETRGVTKSLNDFMSERAVSVIQGAAKMYGVDCSIVKTGETTSAPMDPEMVEIVARSAAEIPGVEHVVRDVSMGGGGEDCTFFMLRIQERGGKATMAIVSTSGAAVGHNSYFDVDEEVIAIGAKLISLVALNCLTQKQ